MARALIREKESFRAIQLIQLAFIALKSSTCQLVTQAETPLNLICLTKLHLKCNYLNYDDSQYGTFSNKTWQYYNCNKDLFPFTTINSFKFYSLLSERFYCNSYSNESCLALKEGIYHIYSMNLIPSPVISIIPQKM